MIKELRLLDAVERAARIHIGGCLFRRSHKEHEGHEEESNSCDLARITATDTPRIRELRGSNIPPLHFSITPSLSPQHAVVSDGHPTDSRNHGYERFAYDGKKYDVGWL